MNNTTAKTEEARKLIREKIERGQRERESRACFERPTAVFDIDGPRYRRSLNQRQFREARGPRGYVVRVERRASRNLQKSPADRDKPSAGRCLPISVPSSEGEKRRGCVLPLPAWRDNECRLMAKPRLSRSAVTARFVARHPERTREAGGRERVHRKQLHRAIRARARSRFAPLMCVGERIIWSRVLPPAEKGRTIEKVITGRAGFARVSTKTRCAGWLVSFFLPAASSAVCMRKIGFECKQ